MKNKIFQFPEKIWNRQALLEVYKVRFPEIKKEYERIVRVIHLNPKKFGEVIKEKQLIFNKDLTELFQMADKNEHSIDFLSKLDLEIHRRYAFNFWILNYALCDGPFHLFYIRLIEESLRKAFPNLNEEQKRSLHSLLLKTDFSSFYQKTMLESLEIVNLLKQIPELWNKIKVNELQGVMDDLLKLKSKNATANKITEKLQPYLDMAKMRKNMQPIYNLFSQGLKYDKNGLTYQMKLKEIERNKKNIENLLKKAERVLSKEEYKKFYLGYLMIKELVYCKDIMGKFDLRLLPFWIEIEKKLVSMVEDEFKIKMAPEDKFPNLPWSLEKFLPKSL